MDPSGTHIEASAPVEAAHLFSADRPIASKGEDLLGRTSFAQSLARAIEGWQGRDSLVIGLYGPWGSGKTSLKNLVVEELDGRISIIEFDPWQWSAQGEIGEAFFEQLAWGIAHRPGVSWWGRRKAGWLAFRIRRYSRLLNVAASGFGLAGRVGAFLAALFVPDPRRRAMTAKRKLGEVLRSLDRPILLVVDDVDRLTQTEIRLVFQLVKSNADFPNLVYLLLFDRGVVEAALNEEGVRGRDHLEKVVQVGLDIPHVERSRLDRALLGVLDEVLLLPEAPNRLDMQHWARLFFDGIQPLVQTLRDVRRFAGTLSFHVSLLRHEATLEVNPIDFIGLETLRVFQPHVYAALPDAKQALTELRPGRGGSAFGGRDAEADTRAALITSLVEKADEPARSAVRGIIRELFPTARWAFGEPAYTAMQDAWFRDLRVCVPEFFDRYFLLAIPERDLSQARLDRVLASTADRDAFVAELRGLQDEGLLDVGLGRLRRFVDEIPREHLSAFITGLFDVGDDLSHDALSPFELSPLERAYFLVEKGLRRFEDIGHRGSVLYEAVTATQALSLPLLVISREVTDEEGMGEADRLASPETLQSLQTICLNRLREAARSGRLLSMPRLLSYLWQWERWASGEPKVWVASLVLTQEGLLAFLRGSVNRILSVGGGDYLRREHYLIRLNEIEPFVEVDELARAVGELRGDALSPEDRRAVGAFERALRRRDAGGNEDGWLDD